MPAARLLVCEGNTAELRAKQVAAGGAIMSDGYADLLRKLLPGAVVDICYPADPGTNLPIGGLEGYDGVAITGSALNVYDRGPTIDPQIELAREVMKAKTPLFGSCWGLQVVTVAMGGVVRVNPKGRELSIARKRCTAARPRCSTLSRCISTRSR
jgi:GMP synthase (glutamine-hydrolysing)